jgi:hypothetical protein
MTNPTHFLDLSDDVFMQLFSYLYCKRTTNSCVPNEKQEPDYLARLFWCFNYKLQYKISNLTHKICVLDINALMAKHMKRLTYAKYYVLPNALRLCATLTILKLRNDPSQTRKPFEMFPPNLTTIEMNDIFESELEILPQSLTSISIILVDALNYQLGTRFPNLIKLNVSYKHMYMFSEENVFDAVIDDLPKNLEHLIVEGFGINGKRFAQNIKCLTSLKTLSVTKNMFNNTFNFRDLPQSLTELKINFGLAFGYVGETDQTQRLIDDLKHLPYLKILQITCVLNFENNICNLLPPNMIYLSVLGKFRHDFIIKHFMRGINDEGQNCWYDKIDYYGEPSFARIQTGFMAIKYSD